MGLIKVFLPNRDFDHSTQVETWGELKQELQGAGVTFTNMKAVCGNNKLEFGAESAKLPIFEGKYQFTLMLLQYKSDKGGIKKMVSAIYDRVVNNSGSTSNSPCPPPLTGDALEEAFIREQAEEIKMEHDYKNLSGNEEEE